jgi:hypothetical protein
MLEREFLHNHSEFIDLIRFDPENAEIWVNTSSMVTGIKMLMGMDPTKDMKDKVARVTL